MFISFLFFDIKGWRIFKSFFFGFIVKYFDCLFLGILVNIMVGNGFFFIVEIVVLFVFVISFKSSFVFVIDCLFNVVINIW